MFRTIWLKTWRDQRWGMLWWALGGITLVYAG